MELSKGDLIYLSVYSDYNTDKKNFVFVTSKKEILFIIHVLNLF